MNKCADMSFKVLFPAVGKLLLSTVANKMVATIFNLQFSECEV